jgi:putative inorganic carbon (HCO3(-)) transporter
MPRLYSRAARFLYRRRWLLLILAAPFLLFPSPITTPALLIVPGLGIIAWLAGEYPFPRTPLNVALLWLSLMVLVSTGVTYDMAVSLPKIAGVILGIGVFYVFVSYRHTARGFWLCMLAFLATGIGVALFGLLGTQWSAKFGFLENFTDRFAPRITGFAGVEQGISPNEVAGALLWVIPLFLALSLVAFTQRRNVLGLPGRWLAPTSLLLVEATLFVLLVFLLCQSRSAYLALAISCTALIPMVVLPRRWRWLFLGFLAVVGIGLGVLVGRYGAERLFDAVLDTPTADSLSQSLGTLGGRTEIWSRALAGVGKYPLSGMGMNTFRYRYNTLDQLHPIFAGKDIAHAHNEFLQAALDLGIPGLVAFAALYLGAFWMLSEVWGAAGTERDEPNASCATANADPHFDWGAAGTERDEPNASPSHSVSLDPSSVRLLVLGLGGGLLAHMLYGLTDAVSLGAKPGILFWMLLGLVVSLYRQTHCPYPVSLGLSQSRVVSLRGAFFLRRSNPQVARRSLRSE